MDETVQPGGETQEAPASPAASSPPSAPPSTPSAPTEASSTVDADTGREAKSKLLDAVLKVVPATTERSVFESDEADAEDAPDPQAPEGQDQAEAPDPDGEDVPDDEPAQEATPAIRKKINKLLKQRRELRQEVEGLRGEVEQLTGSANTGRELEQFARTAQLTGDDVANTLKIAAALRSGDYRTFYEMVAPFVRTAQEYLGIVLPQDLAQRVKAGHMTEQAAREFSRQRFDHRRAQIERNELETAGRQQHVEHVQTDVQRAVTNLENRFAASDADYKAKAPSVRRVAQAMLHERGGTITSVEEALQITKDAYDEVNAQMRAVAPKPKPTNRLPNGSTQTPSARAAPKSLMEAAIQGLEMSRRA